jgi:hypothetical protein
VDEVYIPCPKLDPDFFPEWERSKEALMMQHREHCAE